MFSQSHSLIFSFLPLQAILLWSLLPVEKKPVFICNLHTLAEEKISVQDPAWLRERKDVIFCRHFFFSKGDGDQLAPATAAYIESPRGKSKVNLQTNVKQFCFFSGWAGDKWKLGRVFSGLLPSSWGHVTNYLPFFSASFSSQGHDWAAQTHHPQHATIPQHL